MKPLAALLLATSLFATPGAAEESIRIKGSDTIGGRAMPEIAEAWGKKSPGVRMTVEALGSSTAFVGLFDGSADIGASSRPINEKELATARDLGLKLQEIVIGFDGVAVIVHPKNPLRELSIAQISALFTGKTKRWKEVGGEDVPVRLISRPSYSGTHAFFKEKVLRRGNAKGPEEFAASAELMEENGEILRAVASDPRAMPLDAYIAEVMEILQNQPSLTEICVEHVKRLRLAAERGHYDAIFSALNEAMAKP